MKTLLVFGSIVLNSCATAVQYPVVEPPEVVIAPGVQKILFVSRFDTARIGFDREKLVEVYKLGYTSFIEGLNEGFAETDQINFNLSDTTLTGKWYTIETPEFNDSSVSAILKKYSTDYLLTLDALGVDREQEVDVTEYDDGSKSKRAYYNLVMTVMLSLYDKNGNVVDRIKMDDRQYIDDRSVMSGLLAVGPNIGNFAEVVDPLAFDLGFSISDLFFGHETMVVRLFHSGKVFKEAARLAANGQWLESEKLLLPIAGHSDPKIAGQAAENLSIVYEAMGEYEKSQQWMEQAAK